MPLCKMVEDAVHRPVCRNEITKKKNDMKKKLKNTWRMYSLCTYIHKYLYWLWGSQFFGPCVFGFMFAGIKTYIVCALPFVAVSTEIHFAKMNRQTKNYKVKHLISRRYRGPEVNGRRPCKIQFFYSSSSLTCNAMHGPGGNNDVENQILCPYL